MWASFDPLRAEDCLLSGFLTPMGINALGQVRCDGSFFPNSLIKGVIFRKICLSQHTPQPSRGSSGASVPEAGGQWWQDSGQVRQDVGCQQCQFR